jgi:hypothetical protein
MAFAYVHWLKKKMTSSNNVFKFTVKCLWLYQQYNSIEILTGPTGSGSRRAPLHLVYFLFIDL